LFPVITRDDQHVIYFSFAGGAGHLWIVPIAGGQPKPFGPAGGYRADVSPDGKLMAFMSLEPQGAWFVSSCDMPMCSGVRHVRPLDGGGYLVRWTPDSRSIAYAKTYPGANIWVHPLDASPERQLTHFADGRSILDFAWSRDGKRLAIARTSTSEDIVLFRGLKSK
jgi:Tol biopolymer transport system component